MLSEFIHWCSLVLTVRSQTARTAGFQGPYCVLWLEDGFTPCTRIKLFCSTVIQISRWCYTTDFLTRTCCIVAVISSNLVLSIVHIPVVYEKSKLNTNRTEHARVNQNTTTSTHLGGLFEYVYPCCVQISGILMFIRCMIDATLFIHTTSKHRATHD